jgi:acetyl-CoA carboxylase biotin carboxyl carrier protein
MIDIKQLRAFIKLMVDNDMTEVDLQDEHGERVKLKRGADGAVQYIAPQVPAAQIAPAASPAQTVDAGSGTAPAAPAADDNLVDIESPMPGSFYSAASPDAAPFIKEGDRVSADTVVCIIEAMKVFNEIKAETSGTVVSILVENGQAVEYGYALFKVKPD